MSHRASLLSWWPFSGYFGSKSRSGSSLSSNILHFSIRLFLFYMAILFLWFFIYSDYEGMAWFFTIKATRFFSEIPFSKPQIIDGKFAFSLKTGTSVTPVWYITGPWPVTCTIFITIPLLLSSSGISLLNRVKMILIASFLLFLFHVLYVFIYIHYSVYRNYSLLVERGIGQIVKYSPAKYELFCWLHFFFNTILKFAVAVGIWIGLVSYYKKSDGQHWIRKLF